MTMPARRASKFCAKRRVLWLTIFFQSPHFLCNSWKIKTLARMSTGINLGFQTNSKTLGGVRYFKKTTNKSNSPDTETLRRNASRRAGPETEMRRKFHFCKKDKLLWKPDWRSGGCRLGRKSNQCAHGGRTKSQLALYFFGTSPGTKMGKYYLEDRMRRCPWW